MGFLGSVGLLPLSSGFVSMLEVPAGGTPPGRATGAADLMREASDVDVVVDRVAGLDVGKASVTVCVRVPGPGAARVSETRTYSTMTRQLALMASAAGRKSTPQSSWRTLQLGGGRLQVPVHRGPPDADRGGDLGGGDPGLGELARDGELARRHHAGPVAVAAAGRGGC